jgi:hypothetical protein
MIDQLHRFDDEAAARAAVPSLLVVGDDGTLAWRTDIVSFPRVYDTQNVVTFTDTDTGETITQLSHLSYFYVWIATPVRDLALEALPSCMIVADRDRAADGAADFILNSALPADQLGRYRVAGGPMGAAYPFGA